MSEYTSPAKKAREIATAIMLFGLAIGIYYLSQIPGVPLPVLFQTASVLLLTFAVLVITHFVMRRYTCRLEQNQKGSVDFVIVEHYGRRDTVVCRVYASQILFAARRTAESRKASAEKRKGKPFYRYTANFSTSDRVLAEVKMEETDETFFLEFAADDAFLAQLKNVSGSALNDFI